MAKRFFQNRTAVFTTFAVLLIALIGIFAPVIAPNDPYETNIINKFASYSVQYPLGTDQLGRCVLSRMIFGIRPTLGLAALTMAGTIGIGAVLGIIAGYFRGIAEEIHGICSGGPAGSQCPECDHCQCVYKMGLVCPHDPYRSYAVQG